MARRRPRVYLLTWDFPPSKGGIQRWMRELSVRLPDAELTVFATKVDVDEELTRLRAHLDEVDRALEKGGAVGKRLDFVAQELNREANTLASKAASAELSDCALELKLLIEQMREQVQNIE